MEEKRKINTLLLSKNLKFGDFVLFQEYSQGYYDGEFYYEISKPILGLVLNIFVADQAIAFNYVKWINDNKLIDEVPEIKSHIEWDDYIDILGQWESKPTWKQILKAYRTQNTKDIIDSEEIDWSDGTDS